MAKKKYYYKVVSRELKSFIINDNDYEGIVVQYKLNKFVKPNIADTKLMIFNSLANAIEFSRLHSNFLRIGKIYKVEALNVSYYGICLSFNNFIKTLKTIVKLKKGKKGYLKYNISIPRGTLFADQVKLLKEISR
jgi:hypothetical protein